MNKKLKVFWAEPIVEKHRLNTGKIVTDYRSFLKVACQDGFLNLLDVQLEGKRKMNVLEFLNGARARMKKQPTQ